MHQRREIDQSNGLDTDFERLGLYRPSAGQRSSDRPREPSINNGRGRPEFGYSAGAIAARKVSELARETEGLKRHYQWLARLSDAHDGIAQQSPIPAPVEQSTPERPTTVIRLDNPYLGRRTVAEFYYGVTDADLLAMVSAGNKQAGIFLTGGLSGKHHSRQESDAAVQFVPFEEPEGEPGYSIPVFAKAIPIPWGGSISVDTLTGKPDSGTISLLRDTMDAVVVDRGPNTDLQVWGHQQAMHSGSMHSQ